jgi:hypothetical protein
MYIRGSIFRARFEEVQGVVYHAKNYPGVVNHALNRLDTHSEDDLMYSADTYPGGITTLNEVPSRISPRLVTKPALVLCSSE